MVNIVESLKLKKKRLDEHSPFANNVINNLLEWFKIELTYSSNAIEGNTLSRLETAVVVQKGITIGGKLLKEHLEATNHAKAFDFILSLTNKNTVTEQDILEIHRLVLQNIENDDAGNYRNNRVRIAGTDVIFPNYIKIPELMTKFINDLQHEQDPIEKALFAHYEFVTIHPFIDGNGRTARLLMNLILMQNGYPPAIIKPKDRLKYLKSLEQAQLGGSKDPYKEFVIGCIDKSLNIYIKSIENKDLPIIKLRENLIKIGELAKSTNENNPTIRHWIKLGLIEVTDKTESNFQLFDKIEIAKCHRIRELQKQRFSLEEILGKLSEEFE